MTLNSQLLKHLRKYTVEHAGGTLERMEWRSKKGTLYKPSTVSRALLSLSQEIDEWGNELNPRIKAIHKNGAVFYQYKENAYEKLHKEVKSGKYYRQETKEDDEYDPVAREDQERGFREESEAREIHNRELW